MVNSRPAMRDLLLTTHAHYSPDHLHHMSALEAKLRQMGYTIPPPFKFPNPNRTGCVVVGTIVFVSGHGRDLPSLPEVKHAGKVGRDLTDHIALSLEIGVPIVKDYPVYNFKAEVRLNVTY